MVQSERALAVLFTICLAGLGITALAAWEDWTAGEVLRVGFAVFVVPALMWAALGLWHR